MYIRYMLLALFILLLTSCATTVIDGSQFTTLNTFTNNDTARIYFYRTGEESWNVKGKEFEIHVNGEFIGDLPHGGYFTHEVMPGKTVIMTDTYSNWSNLLTYVIEETTRVDGKVLADLKARDELFIKLQVTDEFWNIKGAIYNVDKNVALEQLKKTSLILNPK